jgi:hypothetical protein
VELSRIAIELALVDAFAELQEGGVEAHDSERQPILLIRCA